MGNHYPPNVPVANKYQQDQVGSTNKNALIGCEEDGVKGNVLLPQTQDGLSDVSNATPKNSPVGMRNTANSMKGVPSNPLNNNPAQGNNESLKATAKVKENKSTF